jgi:hypothetical protein
MGRTIIDEQLKWEEHNSKQCKTISAGIGMLRRAGDFATQVVLITMYNSLVFPHFTYCSTVWHGFRADHINKLYKLQKRAARVTTGSSCHNKRQLKRARRCNDIKV